MINVLLISSSTPDYLWGEDLLTTCFLKIGSHIGKHEKHLMSYGKVTKQT